MKLRPRPSLVVSIDSMGRFAAVVEDKGLRVQADIISWSKSNSMDQTSARLIKHLAIFRNLRLTCNTVFE